MSGSRAKMVRHNTQLVAEAFGIKGGFVRAVKVKGKLHKVKPEDEKWAPRVSTGYVGLYRQMKKMWTKDPEEYKLAVQEASLRLRQSA